MNAGPARWLLSGALLALALLYLSWFGGDAQRLLAWIVFALPPMLLAVLAWRGAKARFWAGVLALAWFSHGVMSAWSHPPTRGYALAELALALLVVGCASWPGLRARFGRGRARR